MHRLHSDLLDSHLNVNPATPRPETGRERHPFERLTVCTTASVSHDIARSFNVSSPHFNVRSGAALPLGLGGHGTLPFSHPPPPLDTSDFSVPYIHLRLLPHIIMQFLTLHGRLRGASSEPGSLSSGKRISHPSLISSQLTHHPTLLLRLRSETPGFESTLPRQD